MFAIRLTEENVEQIRDRYQNGIFVDNLRRLTGRTIPWYFVSGYVNRAGQFLPWAVLPEFTLLDHFELDVDTAQTNWTQMVRKEIPE